jgi:hypothetical protein
MLTTEKRLIELMLNRVNHHFLAGLILLFAGCVAMQGQGKKTIREKQIVSLTVQEYFLDEGMEEPLVESVEKYNEAGERIEIQEFNKKGGIKKWEKYLYDEEGNLVEQQFMDHKGRVTRTEKNIYQDGLRVEKHFFDGKGRMYKKKAYQYEYRQ